MQIGFVTLQEMAEVKWMKMTLRAPFLRQSDFKISKNSAKAKDNEPDFYIYYFVNSKGEAFRNPRIGALWMKVSKKTGEPYMSGNLESPLLPTGQIYIAITKAKPMFDDEKVSWLYDVLWSNQDKEKEQDQDYTPKNNTAHTYDESGNRVYSLDEIPF